MGLKPIKAFNENKSDGVSVTTERTDGYDLLNFVLDDEWEEDIVTHEIEISENTQYSKGKGYRAFKRPYRGFKRMHVIFRKPTPGQWEFTVIVFTPDNKELIFLPAELGELPAKLLPGNLDDNDNAAEFDARLKEAREELAKTIESACRMASSLDYDSAAEMHFLHFKFHLPKKIEMPFHYDGPTIKSARTRGVYCQLRLGGGTG